jgi:hypothetical protein
MANLTGKTIGQLALLTGITQDTLFAVELSGATYHIPYSGLSVGGSYEEVTYDELYSLYSGGTLTPGGYYLITDFQSIYDQPDFDYSGQPIITGNSKTGITEPLLVFATSSTTLSNQAFSPLYPKDKITYDITFTTTEVSNTLAKGRITERIDEFNNRTDYDNRNILFKRYRLYTIRQGVPLNGTIELQSDGTVSGQNTTFTALTIGDVIFMDGNSQLYEITGITDNTTMGVSGDTINSFGCCSVFYKTIEETNGTGYFSFKRPNVKSSDFIEYTTFGDAISNDYAKNTYVGNFANNYQNVGTFLLANNVFLEGAYESNKFGDYCYNNTFGTDNQNNIWGDFCYNNVSTNDIDDNIIGQYFNNNLINANITSNLIGNDFNNNQLLTENGGDFEDNIIGNGFQSNVIYSRFYKNEILDNFNKNIIGDFGNLDNFEFYRNYIRNNFNENIIKRDFQNNQIGTNYQSNEINGEFQGNTILNGFNNNTTGSYFALNNIGNAFNNNTIYDVFYHNTTDYYFNDNIISNDFNTNKIGTYFTDNRPSNNDLFGWIDLSTISTRTYDTLRTSLNNNVGNYILGKELVMRVISTSQYFTIKFTQWTQGGNGGGFQYTRQEFDSNGNSQGNSIIFTKTNNGSEVDVIVPGVVELTRDSQGGLYNTITDTPPFNNQWPGPGDTEWNSIYTQPNNGERFAYNKIGNNFRNNTIGSDFGYGLGDPYGNIINDNFEDNTIGQYAYNNVIGNQFRDNTIGDNFEDNNISSVFQSNTIGNNFQWNVINTSINSVNFAINQESITGFTYSAPGSSATDGTYNGLTGTTNGIGVNATFDVVVSSSAVTSVSIVNQGNFYQVNDTILILGSQIGGTDSVDDVTITITTIIEPSVYETYTCQIFERQGGNKRLSYYDSSDVLNITDVNL